MLKNINMSFFHFCIYGAMGILFVLSGAVASFQSELHSQSLFGFLLISFIINECVGLIVLLAYQLVTETKIRYQLDFISNGHVIVNSLLMGFWLFCRSYNGACSFQDNTYLVEWSCNPGYSSHSLPLETLIFAMMTPLVYAYIFSNVSWTICLVSWLIIVSWIFVCIYVFSAFNATKAVIVYIGFSLVILKSIYENNSKSANLLLEKEKCELEVERVSQQSAKDAKELQNMLNNMAHDLKTVFLIIYIYMYIYIFLIMVFKTVIMYYYSNIVSR